MQWQITKYFKNWSRNIINRSPIGDQCSYQSYVRNTWGKTVYFPNTWSLLVCSESQRESDLSWWTISFHHHESSNEGCLHFWPLMCCMYIAFLKPRFTQILVVTTYTLRGSSVACSFYTIPKNIATVYIYIYMYTLTQVWEDNLMQAAFFCNHHSHNFTNFNSDDINSHWKDCLLHGALQQSPFTHCYVAVQVTTHTVRRTTAAWGFSATTTHTNLMVITYTKTTWDNLLHAPFNINKK